MLCLLNSGILFRHILCLSLSAAERWMGAEDEGLIGQMLCEASSKIDCS